MMTYDLSHEQLEAVHDAVDRVLDEVTVGPVELDYFARDIMDRAGIPTHGLQGFMTGLAIEDYAIEKAGSDADVFFVSGSNDSDTVWQRIPTWESTVGDFVLYLMSLDHGKTDFDSEQITVTVCETLDLDRDQERQRIEECITSALEHDDHNPAALERRLQDRSFEGL